MKNWEISLSKAYNILKRLKTETDINEKIIETFIQHCGKAICKANHIEIPIIFETTNSSLKELIFAFSTLQIPDYENEQFKEQIEKLKQLINDCIFSAKDLDNNDLKVLADFYGVISKICNLINVKER